MIQLISRRFKSTLLPPKVSSISELGRIASTAPQHHPKLFAAMKVFYKRIPKGTPTSVVSKTNFIQWYYKTYIATGSAAPALHLLGLMIPVGYYIGYFKGGHYHPHKEFH